MVEKQILWKWMQRAIWYNLGYNAPIVFDAFIHLQMHSFANYPVLLSLFKWRICHSRRPAHPWPTGFLKGWPPSGFLYPLLFPLRVWKSSVWKAWAHVYYELYSSQLHMPVHFFLQILYCTSIWRYIYISEVNHLLLEQSWKIEIIVLFILL